MIITSFMYLTPAHPAPTGSPPLSYLPALGGIRRGVVYLNVSEDKRG
jgi:hypothetical protein